MVHLMIRLSPLVFASTLACALALGQIASAEPTVAIPGLYNTGMGVAPGDKDSHYVAQGSYGSTVVTPYSTYYQGTSITAGQWISPQMSGTSPNTAPPGTDSGLATYTYNLTFDLTHLHPDTAQITGKIAADNGVEVLLNGHSVYLLDANPVALNSDPDIANFGVLHDLIIDSYFKDGENTLSFVITNFGGSSYTYNPAAFLVTNLSGTAVHNPEPASLLAWGLILGVGGLGYRLRKRKQAIAA
jgi:hypothetical protein